MEEINQICDRVYHRLETGLSPKFLYHSAVHTRYVVRKAVFLAEKEGQDLQSTRLITLGALYHDVGFLNGRENHEINSCKMAREDLSKAGFSGADIEAVCGIVMATKIPQHPQNDLEKIVADADLYYLGTKHFASIGSLLFKELKLNGAQLSQEDWNALQVHFLSAHNYHTDYGRAHLAPVKQEHLRALKASLEN